MKNYNLGPLEQKIMDCMWQDTKLSVSDVHKKLRSQRKIAYTTVMTIMTRLVQKGFLVRNLEGKAYVYSPKNSKQQTTKNIIKKFVSSIIDQYGKEAVTAFTDELRKRE